MTRSVLLEHATAVSKGLRWPHCEGPQLLSNECRISGTSLCRTLVRMHESGCFDSVTGFDMFYGITGASILVLEVVIMLRQGIYYTETSTLLQKMAMLAEKHLRNGKIPGTLHKWATLISELPAVIEKFHAGQQRGSVRCVGEITATQQQPAISDAQLLMGLQHVQTAEISIGEKSRPHPNTSRLAQQHHNIDPSLWMESTHLVNADSSLSTSQRQWQWDDIEAILNS